MKIRNLSSLLSVKFIKEKYKMESIYKFSDYLKNEKIAPIFHCFEGPGTDPEVVVDGKKYLMFTSNNYLGLSTDPRVINAAKSSLNDHGIGPGGSRFLCGNIQTVEQLDKEIASLVGKDDAITFPTGYMANLAVFRALMDPLIDSFPYKKGQGIIFSDEFNHGTIVDGCKLSSAKKIVFQHGNLDDLRRGLYKSKKNTPKMIVTEGVFSPEGELSPLPEICKIAKEFGAILMIDDAHGIGVLGKNGGGTAQHFGLQDEVDIIMGSFDKSLGGIGGFLAGNKKIIEYLRIVSRPYIFSSTIPAVIAGGLIESIKLCRNGEDLRKKLFLNANYLRDHLRKLGYKIYGTDDIPVVPVIIGDESKAMIFSQKLFERDVYLPAFRWPAVSKGLSRMRVTPMATHTVEHLDRFIKTFNEVGKEMGIV